MYGTIYFLDYIDVIDVILYYLATCWLTMINIVLQVLSP